MNRIERHGAAVIKVQIRPIKREIFSLALGLIIDDPLRECTHGGKPGLPLRYMGAALNLLPSPDFLTGPADVTAQPQAKATDKPRAGRIL